MQTRNNTETKAQRHASRPLSTLIVKLECGCEHRWPGSEETAPRRGQGLYCFTHMVETFVDRVSIQQ